MGDGNQQVFGGGWRLSGTSFAALVAAVLTTLATLTVTGTFSTTGTTTLGDATHDTTIGRDLSVTGTLTAGRVGIGALPSAGNKMWVGAADSSTLQQMFIQETDTNHTTYEAINIVGFQNATFDTTLQAATAISGDFETTTSRAAGANQLLAIGVLGAAVGGTNGNFAFYSGPGKGIGSFADGIVAGPTNASALGVGIAPAAGVVDFTGASSIKFGTAGAVQNFTMSGNASQNAYIGLGVDVNNGKSIHMKNTVAAQGTEGIDIGLDTTVNAGANGGLFMWRGAGGGIGTFSTVSGLETDSGASFDVDATAGDTVLFSERAGKAIFVTADPTTFKTGLKVDATNNVSVPNGTLSAKTLQTSNTGAKWTSGAGAPVIACSQGDLFSRTDGGATTSLYVCTAANTWTAK